MYKYSCPCFNKSVFNWTFVSYFTLFMVKPNCVKILLTHTLLFPIWGYGKVESLLILLDLQARCTLHPMVICPTWSTTFKTICVKLFIGLMFLPWYVERWRYVSRTRSVSCRHNKPFSSVTDNLLNILNCFCCAAQTWDRLSGSH